MASGASIVELLVLFGHELRAEGLPVGSGDVITYASATAALDPTDPVDLYWAGRTTLVIGRDQIPVYDRVFRRFFLDERDELPEPWRSTVKPVAEANAMLEIPATEPGASSDDDRPAKLGLMASDVELWRNKSFAACTPDELAAIRRIMARIRLMPPRRTTRRTVGSRSGRRPDLR
ncbi:MAG: CoxE, partial [Actinobacteria bacterium]